MSEGKDEHMSETRRYEGPVKAGMKYRYGSSVLAIENGDAKRDDFVGLFRDGRRTLVRPADDDAAAWARFLPDGPLPNTGCKRPKVGQVWAVSNEFALLVFEVVSLQKNGTSTRKPNRRLLAGREIDGPADGMDASGMMANAVLLFDAPEETTGPRVPAERQLAPGWVRLTTPGRLRGEFPGHPADVSWGCFDSVAEVDCEGAALFAHPSLSGSCASCVGERGVFCPPAPASKPTHVEAKANVTPPCPACNGIPFETKRCPRCGLPSKAEPVRVRLAPVGACRGPLLAHGTPVMRVRGSLLGGPSSFLMCDPCYLHAEKLLADDAEAFRKERAAVAHSTARVGTVPMSIGPGAGVGIWASRGMRGR